MKETEKHSRITLVEARSAKWQVESLLRERGVNAAIGIAREGEDYAVKVSLSSLPAEELPERMGQVHIVYEVVGPIHPRGS